MTFCHLEHFVLSSLRQKSSLSAHDTSLLCIRILVHLCNVKPATQAEGQRIHDSLVPAQYDS